ncbi:MAG: RNA polymerase sigma factor [Verrucomicrobiota bacterium]
MPVSAPKTHAGRPTFRVVFEEEESPLLRYAHGLVGQRETAEDLVQDAFLKLHGHWQEVENPRAWLFRCVRNLSLNHLRDHKREVLDGEAGKKTATGKPTADEQLGKLEAIGTLRMLMAELEPEQRHLLSLKYHEDCKYEQISRATGLSVGNVGYKLHHLLKQLADAMRRMGVESAEG